MPAQRHIGAVRAGTAPALPPSPPGDLPVASGASSPALRPDEEVLADLMRISNEMAALQRELATKNAELAALNEEKNRLIGMAAHDLRNPLAVVLGYAAFLVEDVLPPSAAEAHEVVGIIRSATEHMLGLVDDLLGLSRLDALTLALDLEPVDLATLLAENVTTNGRLAGAKGIRIVLDGDPLPPLALDRRKMVQVFDNLLSNAVKYSPPGATITVSARHDEARREVHVAVTDQGAGIPAHEIGNLFKAFSTTSTKPTAGEPSTGLGLAIVKRIVDGHGGWISAESAVGRGSTFHVALPAPEPSR